MWGTEALLRYAVAAAAGVGVGACAHAVVPAVLGAPAQPARIELQEADAQATQDRCRAELDVPARDVESELTVISSARDLLGTYVTAGSRERICVRGVVDGRRVDASYEAPGTYESSTLKPDGLLRVHAGRSYLVVGKVADRPTPTEDNFGVYLTSTPDGGTTVGKPIYPAGDYGFMGIAADPGIGTGRTALTLTIVPSDAAQAAVDLSDLEWPGPG